MDTCANLDTSDIRYILYIKMMKVYIYTTHIWPGIGHKDDLKA
jgi:hypothetical protein